ncbi:HAD-IIA family hydrolase [Nocardioides sp.]|uniref:HAD-IIA family hydrolase n=1 Tax=Nocardioides sp. TaxID=35761 RepID=UPI003568BDCA
MLSSSDAPLCTGYDLAMFDLDGVVYVGGEAVPGAPADLAAARAAGMRVAFVTNNASRPPERVVEHLVSLGIDAERSDVVTSAQAAARVLLDRFGADARVACLGGEGLRAALLALGLRPVAVDDPDASALATGYGPDVLWRDIMHAAVRVRGGLPWVASNTDRTIPTTYGVAPGHGVLVATLADFSGVQPVVAGKPARPLLEETIRRVGGERPLMIGDRLDTDIEGARNVGVDSLLVLTGVTGLPELAAAAPGERPTFLHPTLAGLSESHPAPEVHGATVQLGGWTARTTDGALRVSGEGAVADWWRVAAVAAWTHLDAAGAVADVSGLAPPSEPAGAGRDNLSA